MAVNRIPHELGKNSLEWPNLRTVVVGGVKSILTSEVVVEKSRTVELIYLILCCFRCVSQQGSLELFKDSLETVLMAPSREAWTLGAQLCANSRR